MPYYTPTEEMLDKIHSRISELALNVKTKQHLEPQDVFFDNQEFLQLMNISRRTAQVWRDSGYIGYSQMGNKIYYRLIDIQDLLNENYNPKKK
ncbi:helix-turn-helix domain-containing protein [Flavobacterium sp. GSP27]|uniref:helix-turn-helix domain-containing protein n=1 Tax=Flavobacterium sp. GSP27 TaxID=2497489 RepID=UPI001F462B48|nr:helix-turn-helix domain-containing protein [Flavobacterium sp. GSP27]